MMRAGAWKWLALAAAMSAPFLPAGAALAEAPAFPERDDPEYDEADHAFLGGPDPPCMLPCALVVLVIYVAVLTVALVLGAALAGVVLAAVAVVGAVCLALAAWLAWQGMWVAAAVALLPVVLAIWAVARRRPNRRHGDAARQP
jgi:hypothetical protein